MNVLEHLMFAQIVLESYPITQLAAWAAGEHIRRAREQLPNNVPWDTTLPNCEPKLVEVG